MHTNGPLFMCACDGVHARMCLYVCHVECMCLCLCCIYLLVSLVCCYLLCVSVCARFVARFRVVDWILLFSQWVDVVVVVVCGTACVCSCVRLSLYVSRVFKLWQLQYQVTSNASSKALATVPHFCVISNSIFLLKLHRRIFYNSIRIDSKTVPCK